jgi:hypothetical protein
MLLLPFLYLPLGATAVELDRHLWQDRLLFLIAPSADDPMVIRQREALNERTDALDDRDLKIFQLYVESPSLFDGEPLADREARELRNKLRSEPTARELILIGKDGSIKRRAPLEIELREIFMQIDDMPMRREEIQEKIEAGQLLTPP